MTWEQDPFLVRPTEARVAWTLAERLPEADAQRVVDVLLEALRPRLHRIRGSEASGWRVTTSPAEVDEWMSLAPLAYDAEARDLVRDPVIDLADEATSAMVWLNASEVAALPPSVRGALLPRFEKAETFGYVWRLLIVAFGVFTLLDDGIDRADRLTLSSVGVLVATVALWSWAQRWSRQRRLAQGEEAWHVRVTRGRLVEHTARPLWWLWSEQVTAVVRIEPDRIVVTPSWAARHLGGFATLRLDPVQVMTVFPRDLGHKDMGVYTLARRTEHVLVVDCAPGRPPLDIAAVGPHLLRWTTDVPGGLTEKLGSVRAVG